MLLSHVDDRHEELVPAFHFVRCHERPQIIELGSLFRQGNSHGLCADSSFECRGERVLVTALRPHPHRLSAPGELPVPSRILLVSHSRQQERMADIDCRFIIYGNLRCPFAVDDKDWQISALRLP